MISEGRLLRDIFLIIAAVLVMAVVMPQHAQAYFPRGVGATPPPSTTCPKGTTYTFDGCSGASLSASFIQPSMFAVYLKDASGNPATATKSPPFNIAGVDFPVGYIGTPTVDARTQSTQAGGNVSGTTVTITSISQGTTPTAGWTMWDDPNAGHAYYTTQPHVISCSGSLPSITCTMDQSLVGHTGVVMNFSPWPGCVTNPGTATTDDTILCKFGNASNGFSPTINHVYFGPQNGHNATVLTASIVNGGHGGITLTNFYATLDQYNTGGIISASNIGINLDAENFECDGGNAGVPVNSPPSSFVFGGSNNCINWKSIGTAGLGNTVTIKYGYFHDWGGNAIGLSEQYTTLAIQANVFINNCGNCGDNTAGGDNGIHGSAIQFGATTTIGAPSNGMTLYNTTVVLPYGFRYGVTTCAITCLLGGQSSAVQWPIDVAGITNISNISALAGHAPGSGLIGFRIGSVPSLKVQHIYANDIGLSGCLLMSGDLQINSGATASMTDNGGGTSTMTWSGFSGTPPLPYPGQAITHGNGSNAVSFTGTLTASGANSNLVISGTPPATLAAGTQILALNEADWQAHPTLIVSGSGANYVVSNGSGSGETQGSQVFTVGQVIQPAGTGGTTATFGTTVASYNGTMIVGGDNTVASNNQWSAFAVRIGNQATLGTDIHDLYDMVSGTAWGISGPGLNGGVCPNASPG